MIFVLNWQHSYYNKGQSLIAQRKQTFRLCYDAIEQHEPIVQYMLLWSSKDHSMSRTIEATVSNFTTHLDPQH